MTGLDLLWFVYFWMPTAVLVDFVALQLFLRLQDKKGRQ